MAAFHSCINETGVNPQRRSQRIVLCKETKGSVSCVWRQHQIWRRVFRLLDNSSEAQQPFPSEFSCLPSDHQDESHVSFLDGSAAALRIPRLWIYSINLKSDYHRIGFVKLASCDGSSVLPLKGYQLSVGRRSSTMEAFTCTGANSSDWYRSSTSIPSMSSLLASLTLSSL